MAHQYMPKIFHDPHKKLSGTPSYKLNVGSLIHKKLVQQDKLMNDANQRPPVVINSNPKTTNFMIN